MSSPARSSVWVRGGAVLAALGFASSVLVHGGIAAAVLSLPKDKKRESVAISLQASKPKPPRPPEAAKLPEPPKTEAPAKSAPRAKAAPSEAKADAAPRPAAAGPTGGEGLPDFGLSLGGTGTGMAVPASGGGGSAPAEVPTQAPKKVLAPAPRPEGDCAEPPIKPKPKSMVQPAYNDRAREAKIEGKVRVELTVDERGKVTSARVLSGLGYGLDEAALAAARQMTLEPATQCGRPVGASFVVSMRFVLGS